MRPAPFITPCSFRANPFRAIFFRRLKAGQKPGFPRCRGRDRWHAAEFRVGDGLTLRKGGRFTVVGVPGEIKVRWHRPLPNAPKAAVLTRQAGRYVGLLTDCNTGTSGLGGDLLFLTSVDGTAFTNSGKTVIPRNQAGEHDQLYRATLVPSFARISMP